jgi:heme/copper-type cytochrome/quinol oxidase subunit 3
MATAQLPVASLADAPPPLPVRPRVQLVGTALAAAASLALLAGLLGVYFARRADVLNTGEPWLPRGTSIPIAQPTMMLATLGLSIITVIWAAWALSVQDRSNSFVALGLTMLFGLAYVNQATYLFSVMGLPVRSDAGVLIYGVAGTHVALMCGAIGYLAVVSLRALSGQYRRLPDGPAAAALYWVAISLAYPVIWFGVFITK